MEQFVSLLFNIGRLIAVVGGGLSVIAICYAGILWMTASGDPNKMGQARMALIGAVGGLIIVGCAFIVPAVISQVILEPVGATGLYSDPGKSCDDILRQQLIFQRTASNAERMQRVVARIQSERSDTCSSDVWDPAVDDANYIAHSVQPTYRVALVDDPSLTGVYSPPRTDDGAACFLQDFWDSKSDRDAYGDNARVGRSMVPETLRVGRTLTDKSLPSQPGSHVGEVRRNSGRDSSNNIIVYWSSDPQQGPSDDARCWLYVSSSRTWNETY